MSKVLNKLQVFHFRSTVHTNTTPTVIRGAKQGGGGGSQPPLNFGEGGSTPPDFEEKN